MIILVAYAAISLLRLRERIEEANRQKALLEDRADALELENADLQYMIDHSDDDEVKEQIARDELGLIQQGETVYSGE
ncbi:MAG: septum formation initiator family protein [Oscillospiraceae bacterium]|nr:septum formation initiator family protein [Oscillospiraceae bacterium]